MQKRHHPWDDDALKADCREDYFAAALAACLAARDLIRAALLRWMTFFEAALSATDETLRTPAALASGSLISSNCLIVVRSFDFVVRLRRLAFRL